jgi:UDP-N-acetylmuramyl pentapeptide phosphotransferase/UDP-N-acetylglucosamine-1-phosphate transferase
MSIKGSAPRSVVVATNANGALINGVNGLAYAVMSFALSTNAAVAVKFQSNATDVTGSIRIAANTSFAVPSGSIPLFRTTAGDPLNINISAASIIGGVITYFEV